MSPALHKGILAGAWVLVATPTGYLVRLAWTMFDRGQHGLALEPIELKMTGLGVALALLALMAGESVRRRVSAPPSAYVPALLLIAVFLPKPLVDLTLVGSTQLGATEGLLLGALVLPALALAANAIAPNLWRRKARDASKGALVDGF